MVSFYAACDVPGLSVLYNYIAGNF